MDFLKNHYEKIILSVVLLGVIFFASMLPGRIAEEQSKLKKITEEIEHGDPKLVKEINLDAHLQDLKREQAPPEVDLSGQHNLFNPVKWVRFPNKEVRKIVSGDEVFRDFVVTKVTTLYYSVTFDGSKGPADALRYYFTFTDEGAPTPGGRKPTIRSLPQKVDEKNDIIALREIQGQAQNPTALVIELLRDKERVTVKSGKDNSYRRVVGYEAEAKFDPESKAFKGLRINSPVSFANETYKVIAITDTAVTIENIITGKRTTKAQAP